MVRTCQANVIDYLVRGIDWNGLMSVSVFLKCLNLKLNMYKPLINDMNQDTFRITRHILLSTSFSVLKKKYRCKCKNIVMAYAIKC